VLGQPAEMVATPDDHQARDRAVVEQAQQGVEEGASAHTTRATSPWRKCTTHHSSHWMSDWPGQPGRRESALGAKAVAGQGAVSITPPPTGLTDQANHIQPY
jgi:hypothetical protein